jgi:hypothetical protein
MEYIDNKCTHWVNFKGNAQEKSSAHVQLSKMIMAYGVNYEQVLGSNVITAYHLMDLSHNKLLSTCNSSM